MIIVMELYEKKCIPCESGGTTLSEDEAKRNLEQIPNWKLYGKKIEREFVFKDFKGAMKFVNNVANLAEDEGHHPDIHIHWNKVMLELWTHSMNGLSENDFIVAAKINNLKI
ncbi:MAG: putative pterin-4-alpha-carbinolamine dehydratase [Nitrosopumilales archaeon]|nr:MAG: putative pterin-4-alpha-carbinolamine dehydratase [Nitrosopumilales archaeon]